MYIYIYTHKLYTQLDFIDLLASFTCTFHVLSSQSDLERVHSYWCYTHPSDKWTDVMAMMLVVEVYWSPCPFLHPFHPQTSICKTFSQRIFPVPSFISTFDFIFKPIHSIGNIQQNKYNLLPSKSPKKSPPPFGAFNRSNRSSSSSGSPWKAPNASLSSFPSTSRVRRRESCRTGEGTSHHWTGFVAGKHWEFLRKLGGWKSIKKNIEIGKIKWKWLIEMILLGSIQYHKDL